MTPTRKPIHPDVPTETAWQTGRRLYIKCGYKSQLNNGLRELGAHWDAAERALWIGSTKKAAVIELVQAHQARIDAIEDVKQRGHWITIPYEHEEARERATALGALWDHPTKRWALRSKEDLAEVAGMVRAWHQDREAEREAEREQRRQARAANALAERRQAAADAARRREQIIAGSGRTSTGVTARLREVFTRRMNKATALETARKPGQVIRLKDGRRALVMDRKVWFTDEESASSVCWHAETHDEAHWDFDYELLIVEPTGEELDAEAAAAAERADAAEIHTLMTAVAGLTGARPGDRHTPVPEEETAGTITVTTGLAAVIPDGRLILTRDGRLIWQHPGYYDDYVRSEGVSDDPGLVGRVRALLAGGDRRRVVQGQLPVYYDLRSQL